jgi:hypothetical protein
VLNRWLETFHHEVVEKIWRYIVIEVSNKDGVLFYSIDELVSYGALNSVPLNNIHSRKRFPTKEGAIEYLKGGIKCLKSSNPVLIPTLRKYGL